MPKPLTVWITTNWKILRDGNTRTPYLHPKKLVEVKKQQLEPRHGTMNWFKIGKVYIKAIYCHPTYLTYVQSTLCKMPGWMKQKLESRLLGDISITSDT